MRVFRTVFYKLYDTEEVNKDEFVEKDRAGDAHQRCVDLTWESFVSLLSSFTSNPTSATNVASTARRYLDQGLNRCRESGL